MNRLQKKCVVASAGFHLLLLVLLFVGPAFLTPEARTVDIPVINFVPYITTDEAISGGGNPKGSPPPMADPAPPTPAPQRQETPPPKPEPAVKEVPKPQPETQPKPSEKNDSFAVEQSSKPKPRKIEVSTTIVRRNTSGRANNRSNSAAQEVAAAQRAAQRAGQAIAGIAGGLSKSTSVELQGTGGGGVPYANFLAAVKKAYTDAWVVPASLSTDLATVTVSVTIARNGKVISSTIVRRSGSTEVDQSVQATLDRVTYAAPLPPNAREDERTVTIDFNLKAKLLG